MVLSRTFYSYGVLAVVLWAASSLSATVYEVGPGKPYTTIGSAPWATLQPGDIVKIYWRDTPYKEKWVIARNGTASAWIVVSGVPGPGGQLPVIDGQNAVAAPGLNYWNQERSVLKIGGANVPTDTVPSYIRVENLDIRNARQPYTFKATDGTVRSYTKNASAIYIEKGSNITIRNCTIHDSGNGLMAASSNSTVTSNLRLERNYFYSNGNPSSAYEHNTYTAAIGLVAEYNRYGPLRTGALGSGLKDRSAGTLIRYNWIEGGNRLLDLVDGEDSLQIRTHAKYRTTFVYGNVLTKLDDGTNRQIIHYGGDSGATANYRKGTLYLYNNTIVTRRVLNKTVLVRLSTNEEACDARNNIFYGPGLGSTLALLEESGVMELTRNWFKTGWKLSHAGFVGTLRDDKTTITGDSPGWVNEAAEDYRLASTSPLIGAAALLDAAVLPSYDVVLEYAKHQKYVKRPRVDMLDIGAFEYRY